MEVIVDSWTGRHADALIRALRESNEGFANRLGFAARTVAYWRANPDMVLTREKQEALDTVLFQARDDARARFAAFIGQGAAQAVPQPREAPESGLESLAQVAQWITASNTSQEAIAELDQATASLAEAHTRAPAGKILPEVLRLHQRAQGILNGGQQRLNHRRELIRIDSDLLAHACLLLGDLNQDLLAEEVGAAAVLYAHEAGSNEANAWYARAKTARWQDKFVDAADFARRGFDLSGEGPMQLQLAWYEANASALLGDVIRARQAVRRAEKAAESSPATEGAQSAWSFPVERQALFAMSFATRTGDPDAALRAVQVADEAFAQEEHSFPALWAQFRVGAGMALIMKDALDGAAVEVNKMLDLPADLRMSTVTRYLEDFEPLLRKPRFQGSRIAADLSQRIRVFKAAALAEDELETE